MYLPLYKVADAPFYIQGDNISRFVLVGFENFKKKYDLCKVKAELRLLDTELLKGHLKNKKNESVATDSNLWEQI